MIDWRALGYATGIFLLLLLVTIAHSSDASLLIIGVPCGFVAGYLAGGFLKGSVHGLLIGSGIGLFFLVGASYLATRGPVSPGIGLSIFVVLLGGLFITAQGVVAGAVGGLLRSHV